jgi:hypothetical protein
MTQPPDADSAGRLRASMDASRSRTNADGSLPRASLAARRSLSVIPGLGPCWRWTARSGPAMTAVRDGQSHLASLVMKFSQPRGLRGRNVCRLIGFQSPRCARRAGGIYCPIVYSMFLDQVGADFRSMNLSYEGVPGWPLESGFVVAVADSLPILVSVIMMQFVLLERPVQQPAAP